MRWGKHFKIVRNALLYFHKTKPFLSLKLSTKQVNIQQYFPHISVSFDLLGFPFEQKHSTIKVERGWGPEVKMWDVFYVV